jgi:hypothetical protein
MRRNLIQIPQLYRWRYKLETKQILRVTVNIAGLWSNRETFLTQMHKDGRITIIDPVMSRLKGDESTLEGYDMDVTIEPA